LAAFHQLFCGNQVRGPKCHYTGRVIPPAIKGKDKVAKTRKHLKSEGWDIVRKTSFAYPDYFTDCDMLVIVGHTDKKLFSQDNEMNWEILGTPKK